MLGWTAHSRQMPHFCPFVLARHFDCDRDGLLEFFVGVVLFRVAAAVYFLTHLLVAAAPVVMLAKTPASGI